MRSTILSIFFLISLSELSPLAQAPPPDSSAIDEARKIHESFLKEKRETNAPQNFPSDRPEINVETKNFPETFVDANVSGKCYTFYSVEIADPERLIRKEEKKLKSKFLFRCIPVDEVNEFIKSLNAALIKKGYVTSKFYLDPKSNFVLGKLRVEFMEGRVDRISVNQNSTSRNKIQIHTAFPFAQGKPLRLQDIEQGLEQINRMGFPQAKMNIRPSEKIGFSDVEIIQKKDYAADFTTKFSDAGGETYGILAPSYNLRLKNALGLNEEISLNYNHSSKYFMNLFKDSHSASFVLPVGYFTLSHSIGGSKYSQPLQGRNGDYLSTGNSTTSISKVEYVFLRKDNMKLAGVYALTIKDTKAYVNGLLVEVSSRKLTLGEASLRIQKYFNGGSIDFSVAKKKGLRLYGALEDPPDLKEFEPQAQFDASSLDLKLHLNIGLKQIKSFNSSLFAQFSEGVLYGSEQLSPPISGFESNGHSGDVGWYSNNSISVRPFDVSRPEFKNYLISLSVDFGCVFSAFDFEKRCLAGLGFKYTLSHKGFSYVFAYGIPDPFYNDFDEPESFVSSHEVTLNFNFL